MPLVAARESVAGMEMGFARRYATTENGPSATSSGLLQNHRAPARRRDSMRNVDLYGFALRLRRNAPRFHESLPGLHLKPADYQGTAKCLSPGVAASTRR